MEVVAPGRSWCCRACVEISGKNAPFLPNILPDFPVPPTHDRFTLVRRRDSHHQDHPLVSHQTQQLPCPATRHPAVRILRLAVPDRILEYLKSLLNTPSEQWATPPTVLPAAAVLRKFESAIPLLCPATPPEHSKEFAQQLTAMFGRTMARDNAQRNEVSLSPTDVLNRVGPDHLLSFLVIVPSIIREEKGIRAANYVVAFLSKLLAFLEKDFDCYFASRDKKLLNGADGGVEPIAMDCSHGKTEPSGSDDDLIQDQDCHVDEKQFHLQVQQQSDKASLPGVPSVDEPRVTDPQSASCTSTVTEEYLSQSLWTADDFVGASGTGGGAVDGCHVRLTGSSQPHPAQSDCGEKAEEGMVPGDDGTESRHSPLTSACDGLEEDLEMTPILRADDQRKSPQAKAVTHSEVAKLDESVQPMELDALADPSWGQEPNENIDTD
eukprot:NODE_660_length_2002_cov_23.651306_g610_i0.p1 GENE.NODE_660_length_2002_cov_23.651306_g610_i0~~NODE_660_length_2002_cov_23.651306_g610_i0.p1  ORF type:complete len:437 (-),score=72.81 NODE_660_length_2002_cov_23.651306_g610_i0:4-1314(-)